MFFIEFNSYDYKELSLLTDRKLFYDQLNLCSISLVRGLNAGQLVMATVKKLLRKYNSGIDATVIGLKIE
ncbi:uncharacterized protein KQ657_004799 [Scheffersomyces spartinae]|uniref:Uncharacterized protein n=1 Tax=Scheffersomyces spartinae TaxID=45513 RepID=A0A9P7VAM3_9ASCO|nr:uncharacterized protein KQ657_004799 [Scheffersomyces spartinae]KAG7194091.1 hypothetical protein KQ657_004799 [Scheffersomyces spartinae]